jgi:hypothetical protein
VNLKRPIEKSFAIQETSKLHQLTWKDTHPQKDIVPFVADNEPIIVFKSQRDIFLNENIPYSHYQHKSSNVLVNRSSAQLGFNTKRQITGAPTIDDLKKVKVYNNNLKPNVIFIREDTKLESEDTKTGNAESIQQDLESKMKKNDFELLNGTNQAFVDFVENENKKSQSEVIVQIPLGSSSVDQSNSLVLYQKPFNPRESVLVDETIDEEEDEEYAPKEFYEVLTEEPVQQRLIHTEKWPNPSTMKAAQTLPIIHSASIRSNSVFQSASLIQTSQSPILRSTSLMRSVPKQANGFRPPSNKHRPTEIIIQPTSIVQSSPITYIQRVKEPEILKIPRKERLPPLITRSISPKPKYVFRQMSSNQRSVTSRNSQKEHWNFSQTPQIFYNEPKIYSSEEPIILNHILRRESRQNIDAELEPEKTYIINLNTQTSNQPQTNSVMIRDVTSANSDNSNNKEL